MGDEGQMQPQGEAGRAGEAGKASRARSDKLDQPESWEGPAKKDGLGCPDDLGKMKKLMVQADPKENDNLKMEQSWNDKTKMFGALPTSP